MGKTRDLVKKTGDSKGTFHARMGMIKDRNGTDQTEAEELKERWYPPLPPQLLRQQREHGKLSVQGVGELTQSGGRLLSWGAGGPWRRGARAEPRRL